MAASEEPLPLVDPDDRSASDAGAAILSVLASTDGTVVATHAAARKLTSIHRWSFSQAESPDRFTAEPPVRDRARLHQLDATGVVRLGAHVRPGDVLVGRVRSRGRAPLDTSLRVPPGATGTVSYVRRIPASETTQGRVEVEITKHRVLRVGDRLRLEGHTAVVHAIVESLGGEDLAWPGVHGERRVEKIDCAEDRLTARSIGPYSLVTQQPLTGGRALGSPRVGEAELCALEARRAFLVAHEMLTVKSDDVEGRTRAYEAIVLGTSRVEPSVPESTKVLLRELRALAFEIDDVEDVLADLEPDAPASVDRPLRITLSTSDQVRRASCGAVTDAWTLDAKTHVPVPGGLFCQRIFGPVRDYECACGKHTSRPTEATVCESCGVPVVPSRVRRERFGHVELATPVAHPWRLAPIARLLGVDASHVLRVLEGAVTLGGESPVAVDDTGGTAIEAGLRALDLGALARGEGPRAVLAGQLLAEQLRAEDLMLTAWPVLPPDLRPLVPLDDGKWATSDLNDLFREVVQLSARVARLRERDAPAVIQRAERARLQRAVGQLVENGGVFGRAAFDDRQLRSLSDMVLGPDGRARAQLSGKRVDYAGAARVVLRPIVLDRALLPRTMAMELFKPWIYGELEKDGHVTTIRAAKQMVEAGDPRALDALERVVRMRPAILFPLRRDGTPPPTRVGAFEIGLWDENVVGLAPEGAQWLDLPANDEASVTVHLPIDPRAVSEANAVLTPWHRAFRQVVPPGSGALHRKLRAVVVSSSDCGSIERGIASCPLEGAPCAVCARAPVETPLGLRAADALSEHEARVLAAASQEELSDLDGGHVAIALRPQAAPGWIREMLSERGASERLMEAALAAEIDPVDDLVTRAMLGRLGPRAMR